MYCENNPVLKQDSAGELGTLALCAIGGVASALIDYGGQVLDNYRSGLRGSDMWCEVNVGSIVASSFSGVLSAIPGGGFAAIAIDVLGSAAIKQGTNYLIDYFDNDPSTNRTWNTYQYMNDVVLNALTAGADCLFQVGKYVPKFIREVKSEARDKGIKGTTKLTKYLSTKQVTTVLSNAAYSEVMSRIYPWTSYQS